jgi:apolipoprotein N-acyltransferase
LLYGAWRAGESSASGFEVAIVQGNVASDLRWNRSAAGRVLHRYGALTRDAIGDAHRPPPALIVWPENAIQTPIDDASYGPPLRRLADRVPLLIGAPRSEERDGRRRHFNSAVLLRPDGGVESYDKRRLLAFSETRPFGAIASLAPRGDLAPDTYTAGERAGFVDVGGRRLAVTICMEALYPALAREAVHGGATAIVNVSNDGWYAGRGGASQHLAQVRFRAIETRLPVVRATTTGISAVIAPDGTLLGTLEEGASGVLRVDLPFPGEASLYARFGDAFALGCIALWGIGLLSWLRSSLTSS